MSAPIIIASFAIVFLLMAGFKASRGMPLTHPQVRTWLAVAVIFAVVSGWLFQR